MRKKLLTTMLLCGFCVSLLCGCGKQEEELKDSLVDTEQEEKREVYETVVQESKYDEIGDCFGPSYIYDPTTGKPYDLGGMEIIIRDWWFIEESAELMNDYEEARKDYREWIQDTYNFTIREVAMGDEETGIQDFVDYVDAGGDEKNYIFTLPQNSELISAMGNHYMYDLSGLDCLDFTDYKWKKNKVNEQFTTQEGGIYAMNAVFAQPGQGLFFNKRLLMEAGIDPETLYDMQANGTWTQDGCMDIISKVQQATGSGDLLKNFDCEKQSETQWALYREAFKNGENAFLIDKVSQAAPGRFLYDMEDEIGFVTFPKGPEGEDYVDGIQKDVLIIPGCYDAKKAWQIAFAYNLWTNDVPVYETVIYLEHYWKYNLDSRALKETIVRMIADALGMEPPKLEKGKMCEEGQMDERWILLNNVGGRDD